MSKKQWWVYGLLAATGIGAMGYGWFRGVDLEVVRVATGSFEQAVEDTGTVKSHDSQSVCLETSGRIVTVLVEKGQRVTKGALLLKLDAIDLQITKTTVQQARNTYHTALKDWEKSRKLYAAGAISEKELETFEINLKNTNSAYQAAQLQMDKMARGVLIRAPRTGIILDRQVEPGDYIETGSPAFIIGEPSDLEIDAEIPAEEAVRIQPGNPVVISGKSTDAPTLRGRVIKIAPMAKNVVSSLGVNQKRQTVTIGFTGSSGLFKPGADVDVKIITSRAPNVTKVPISAVFDYQGRPCVFRIENRKAVLRPLVKTAENDDAVVVKSGLKPGDLILARPDNTVKEGIRVRVPSL